MTEVFSTIEIGSSTLDLVRGELRDSQNTLALSPLETAFLAYLARRRDTVVSKEQLAREVWGHHENVQSRAVDASVARIRSKLAPFRVEIVSYRGRGLSLSVAEVTPVRDVALARPLVGRATEATAVRTALREPGLLCLWGPPGVGKTALAESLPGAHVVQGMGTDALTAEVARVLGCAVDALGEAMRKDGRVWVVDEQEARTPDEIELVRIWSRDARVLLVSVPRVEAAHELRLQPLEDDDAAVLLADLCGESPAAVRPLVGATDRLPRQLTVIANAVRFVGLETFLGMAQQPQAYPALEQAVGALWTTLPDACQDVLAAVSVFADTFDVAAAAAVAERRPFEVLGQLEDLWTRSLIQGERGVFRLLSPVRAVAERHRGPRVEARLKQWCLGLLEENARGGTRWLRHRHDLARQLVVCDDEEAVVLGLLVVELLYQEHDPEAMLAAALVRDGRPRVVIVALQVLLARLKRQFEFAQGLAASIAEPHPVWTVEALRRLAHTSLPPHHGGEAVLALEPRLPAVLFTALIAFGGVCGWPVPLETCLRLAPLAKLHGWIPAERAMYLCATITAREAGDPRWIEYAQRANDEAAVTSHLRLGRPLDALAAARARYDGARDLLERLGMASMQAAILAGLGRDAEARAVMRANPWSEGGHGAYFQLAEELTGTPQTYKQAVLQAWVERWRRGDLFELEDTAPDTTFTIHWVLAQRSR